MKINLSAAVAAATLTTLLAGCGGGSDGGSTTTASTASFPFAAAYRARVTAGSTDNFAVSGTCTGTARLVNGAPSPATFQGVSGYAASQSLTMNLSGCTPATSTSTGFEFYDTGFAPLGSTIIGSEYEKFVSRPPALPATGRVGDGGAYATYTVYSDQNYTSLVGNRALSYVVEPDTANSAIVNLISKTTDVSGRLLYTQQARYRIDMNGAFTLVSIDGQASTTSNAHLVLTRQ